MEQRQWMHASTPTPGRRPRILVEDDGVAIPGSPAAAGGAVGADVILCRGPADAGERCPLVTDGACPLGTPDVVVCALGGPWRRSVESAWRAGGVHVVAVEPDLPGGWAARLGAAVASAFASAVSAPGGE